MVETKRRTDHSSNKGGKTTLHEIEVNPPPTGQKKKKMVQGQNLSPPHEKKKGNKQWWNAHIAKRKGTQKKCVGLNTVFQQPEQM